MGLFISMGAFCNSMGAFCAAYGHALVPGACGGVVVPGRAAVSVDLVCKKDEKRIVFALLTFFTPPMRNAGFDAYICTSTVAAPFGQCHRDTPPAAA